MAKEMIRILVLLISLGIVGNCQAILMDRGNGMVYDTDQDLTWLKDTNIARSLGYADDGKLHALQVMDFVDNFVYANYDDWRLPVFDSAACYSSASFYNGLECLTEDTSSGEMTFMFKEILGNNFWMDSDAPGTYCASGVGSCLVNVGADGVSFENLVPALYWVRTINTNDPWNFLTYSFNTAGGSHYEAHPEFASAYVWLVRSGDVSSIPEPDLLLLLAVGLVVVAVAKRKQHNLFATGQYT